MPTLQNTIHNERIKLLATALNNLALAVVIAGVVALGINGQIHGGWRAVTTLLWVVFGIALHHCARFALGELRE